MKKYSVSAVPVIGKEGIIFGVVDMLDILTFVANKMGYTTPDPSSSLRAVKELLSKTIKDVVGISGRNRFICSKNTSNIYEIVDLLSSKDVHRVGIVDQNNDLIGFISQSDIIKYIEANEGKLYAKLNQKISEVWDMNPKKVESICQDQFIIDALTVLERKKISGMAVVDKEGKILGNISTSDLKRMDTESPEQLCYDIYQSIDQYIRSVKSVKESGFPTFEPIFVKPSDYVSQVIRSVNSKHVHRVYIVDEDQKPINEISLCDIIAQFRRPQSD